MSAPHTEEDAPAEEDKPTPLLDCEVVPTTSGAHAIRDRITGEVMHPIVGPQVEAERLYLEPSRLVDRLARREREALVLLDVGLGAGSTALAAWRASELRPPGGQRLAIVSFDQSTHALELAIRSDHAAAFGFSQDEAEAARKLTLSGQVSGRSTDWRLSLGTLPGTLHSEPSQSADIVFWDPFSPTANPELWTTTAFVAVRRLCRTGATLHTYSGATRVRAALLLAGFAVGTGKVISSGRVSTIAAASPLQLEHPLDQRWLERLARSSAAFPHDASPDALSIVRNAAQFRPAG